MAKFRKKPIVVEAVQYTGENYSDILVWAGDTKITHHWNEDVRFLKIPTLEGDMFADIGDWIIKGVKDEFYPCKPDIFEATYDLVEEETDSNPNDLRYN